MQAGQGNIWAGIGIVDRVDLGPLDQGLARVEIPAEEGIHHPANSDHLVADAGIQEVMTDRVARMHRLVRVEVHHHRLGADRQAAGEHVEAVHRFLQVHQPLPGLVIGPVQFGRVADPGHPDPGAAVIGLHEHRIADAFGDHVQVEWLVVASCGVGVLRVFRRVLVRNQNGLRHLETKPHHGAVCGVFFHTLKGERAVEQVDIIHQRGLLEPLAGMVVPVSQPVDHQIVTWFVPQVERFHRHPLDVVGMQVLPTVADRANPAHDGLERGGPILLGAQQQSDQVRGLSHPVSTSQQNRGR